MLPKFVFILGLILCLSAVKIDHKLSDIYAAVGISHFTDQTDLDTSHQQEQYNHQLDGNGEANQEEHFELNDQNILHQRGGRSGGSRGGSRSSSRSSRSSISRSSSKGSSSGGKSKSFFGSLFGGKSSSKKNPSGSSFGSRKGGNFSISGGKSNFSIFGGKNNFTNIRPNNFSIPSGGNNFSNFNRINNYSNNGGLVPRPNPQVIVIPNSRRIISPYYGYTNYYLTPGYYYPRYRRPTTNYEIDCQKYVNSPKFRLTNNYFNDPDYMECMRILEDMRSSGKYPQMNFGQIFRNNNFNGFGNNTRFGNFTAGNFTR